MEERPIRVLLVEDNPGDARLLREMLSEVSRPEFELTHVEHLGRARQSLRDQTFDVVLLDLALADSLQFETLTKINDEAWNVPIVVLTGLNDDLFARLAVEEGAQDYLVKGQVDAFSLVRSIRFAIERHGRQPGPFQTA